MGFSYILYFRIWDDSKIKQDNLNDLLSVWHDNWLIADIQILVRKDFSNYKINFEFIHIKNEKIRTRITFIENGHEIVKGYKDYLEGKDFLTLNEFLMYLENEKKNIFNDFLEIKNIQDQTQDLNMLLVTESLN